MKKYFGSTCIPVRKQNGLGQIIEFIDRSCVGVVKLQEGGKRCSKKF